MLEEDNNIPEYITIYNKVKLEKTGRFIYYSDNFGIFHFYIEYNSISMCFIYSISIISVNNRFYSSKKFNSLQETIKDLRIEAKRIMNECLIISNFDSNITDILDENY